MDQQVSRQRMLPHDSPGSKHITRKVLTTYTFLLSGLTITALTVAVLLQMQVLTDFVKNHLVFTMLLTSLLMTGNLSMLNRYDEQKAGKVMFWTLNCVLTGLPMLAIEPALLLKSSVCSVILVLILSLKSFIIPNSVLETLVKPISAVHAVVIVCSTYSTLFGSLSSIVSSIVYIISLHGGFLVYSGLMICNSQRLMLNAKHPRFDPIVTSLVLYMNTINLFSRIAVFSSVKVIVEETDKFCKT